MTFRGPWGDVLGTSCVGWELGKLWDSLSWTTSWHLKPYKKSVQGTCPLCAKQYSRLVQTDNSKLVQWEGSQKYIWLQKKLAPCWKLTFWNSTRTFCDKNHFNNVWDKRNFIGNWLFETAPEHFVTKIILTMCEIKEISYLPECKRNSKKILRLSNITFLHLMFLVINLKNNSVTYVKQTIWYLLPFYFSTCNWPIQIIFWKKWKYWKKEAFFASIKTDTKLTSNYQPKKLIILDGIIRAEATTVVSQVVHVQEKSFIHDINKPTVKQLKNSYTFFVDSIFSQWIREATWTTRIFSSRGWQVVEENN